MDLSINGLPLNLPDGADRVPSGNYKDRFILPVVRTVVQTDTVLTFNEHPSGPISLTLGQELGHGFFGTVYKTDSVIDPDVPLIVKVLNFAPVIATHSSNPSTITADIRNRIIDNFKYDTFLESLSQIIVHDTTEGVRFREINLQGPFAAKFYLLGSDTTALYIVSEALDNTVFNRLFPKVPGEGVRTLAIAAVFKTVILQISKIFDYLYDNLQFLHRDCKNNNIMYKMIDGRLHVRLIDFGLSCMTYRNIKIQTDNTFRGIIHCNSRIRDMYTFLWELRYFLINGYNLDHNCDFVDILNIMLARGWADPTIWYITWVDSNLDEPGAISNCDARAVYNIFNSVNFTFDNLSSKITGPWHTQLVMLTSNWAGKLSIEQLVEIHKDIITDSRDTGPSPFSKFLKCADDPDYDTFERNFSTQFRSIDDIREITTVRNKAGQTPLMLACALNNEALVNRIINLDGMRLAVQDNAGNTCLHFACRKASALMDHKADWEKAKRIILRLLTRNPILSEKRNFANQGPGNPAVSTDPRIRAYVKRVKTYIWQFWKRNPDTNLARGGSRGSSGRSRGSRRTRRLGRRMVRQTYKH